MAVISSSSTQHVRHRDGLEDHRVSSGTLTRTQKRRQQRKRREIMSRSLFNAVVSDVTQCDSSAPVVTLPTRHNHYQPPAVGPHNLQHTGESRSHCYSTPSNDSQLDNCMLQIQPVAHCFKESEVPDIQTIAAPCLLPTRRWDIAIRQEGLERLNSRPKRSYHYQIFV